jgi:hypothetical protein
MSLDDAEFQWEQAVLSKVLENAAPSLGLEA